MRGPNGTEVSVTNGTACTNLLGNFSHNYPLGQSFGGGIVLTQAGSAVVDLEIGAAGGGSDAATVLDVNHPEVETPTSVVGTVGVVANGTCLLPSAP
jgi:hypothetical protein